MCEYVTMPNTQGKQGKAIADSKNTKNCDNKLIRPSLRKDKVAADRASRRSHYKVLYDQNKPTMYVQTGESASGNSLQNPLQGKVLAVMQEEMLPLHLM